MVFVVTLLSHSLKEIGWKEPCRLKVLGTDQYLTMSTHKEDETSRFSLILNRNKEHPHTIFQLIPADKKYYDESPLVAPFFLTNQASPKRVFWVHLADDFWSISSREDGIPSEAYLSRNEPSEREALSFVIVPHFQSDNFHTARHNYRIIEKFKRQVMTSENFGDISFEDVTKALTDLIFFVTISDDTDPLTRTGVVQKERQKLLGSTLYVTLLVSLLHINSLAETPEGENILRLTWALLRHIVRENPNNGKILQEHLNIAKLSKDQSSSDILLVRNTHKLKLLKETFFKYDKSGDGNLSLDEMEGVLMDLGYSKGEAAQIFKRLDADNSGEIAFDEFVRGFADEFLGENASSEKIGRQITDKQMVLARQVFFRYDLDQSGEIDREELMYLMRDLGIPVESQKGSALLSLLEENPGEVLNFSAFVKAIDIWSEAVEGPRASHIEMAGSVHSWQHTPDTLLEIFRDNRHLLFDLTQIQVNIIVNLLRETLNPGYLRLLGTLCTYQGRAIATNQKMIVLAMQQHEEDIFVKRKVVHNSEVEVFDSESNKWMNVLEFVDIGEKRGTTQYDYYVQFLTLLGTICLGRNVQAIQLVSSVMSFKEAFIGLKSDLLFPAIRTAYSRIVLNVFAISSLNTDWVDLKRVWTLDDIQNLNDIIQLEPSFDPSQTEKKLKTGNPEHTLAFLLNYLGEERNFRFDRKQCETGQPYFLLSIMELLRSSVNFGVLKRLPEKYIIARLREVLKTRYSDGKIIDFNGASRELGPEWLPTLISIWVICVDMLEMYYDIERNKSLLHLIHDFYKANQKNLPSGSEWTRHLRRQLEESFDPSAIGLDSIEFSLGDCLLDLLKVGNNELSSRSLSLLYRIVRSESKPASLMKVVKKIDIVTDRRKIKGVDSLQKKVKMLEQLANSPQLSDEQEAELRETVANLISKCIDTSHAPPSDDQLDGSEFNFLFAEPIRHNQNMLRNLYAHDVIFSILRLPLMEDQFGLIDKTGAMSYLFVSCYDWLRAFCFKNERNQRVLFKYLDFMTQQMVRYGSQLPGIAWAIIEIFKDNSELCSKISETNIQPFINMISDDSRGMSTYLTFLKILINPGGEFLRTTQNVVLRLLMRNRGTLLFLSKKEELRNLDRTQLSAFKNSIVAILALAAGGRNHFTELTCQQLLTVDDCLAVLDQDVAHGQWIFYVFAYFLDEVYLNTEVTATAAMILNEPGKTVSILREFSDFFATYKKEISPLAMQPDSTTSFFSDEFKLDTAISFIRNFYGKHFVPKDDEAISTVTHSLIDGLLHVGGRMLDIYKITAGKNLSYNTLRLTGIKTAISAMTSDFPGSERYSHRLQHLYSAVEDITKATTVKVKDESDLWTTLDRSADEKAYSCIVSLIPDPDDSPTYVELLVGHIRDTRHRDDKLKLLSLKTLLAQIVEAGDNRLKIQLNHVRFNAPLAALRHIGSSDRELQTDAVKYLNEALDDGLDTENPRTLIAVKELIVREFTSQGYGSFFADVSNILHAAKVLMKSTVQPGRESHFAGSNTLLNSDSATVGDDKKTTAKGPRRGRGKKPRHPTRRGTDTEPSMGINTEEYSTPLRQSIELAGELLRMISLLAQGSDDRDNVFRVLLQHQKGDFQSRDILKELAQFLRVYNWETLFSTDDANDDKMSTIYLALRLFRTLRECIKGVHKNKMVALTSGVCIAGNSILLLPPIESNGGATEKLLARTLKELKIEVLELLLTFLDGADSRINNKLVKLLNFEATLRSTEPLAHKTQDPEETKIGSYAYRLMKELHDRDGTHNQDLLEAVTRSEEYCKSRIGRIELMMDGEIHLAYFPIPPECRDFNRASLDQALIDMEINWRKHQDKLSGLMEWTEEYLVKLEHRGEVCILLTNRENSSFCFEPPRSSSG